MATPGDPVNDVGGDEGDTGPRISVAVGVTVGLLASLIQSAGLAMQRRSHLANAALPHEQRKKDWRRPLWLSGFIIFITSNVLSTVFQLGALPILLLGPLGAVSLIFNAFAARLILGDRFSKFLLVGTIFIFGGATMIGIFGTYSEGAHTLAELIKLYSRPPFLVWISFFAFGIVIALVFAHLADLALTRKIKKRQAEWERRQSSSFSTDDEVLPLPSSSDPNHHPSEDLELSPSTPIITLPSANSDGAAANRGRPVSMPTRGVQNPESPTVTPSSEDPRPLPNQDELGLGQAGGFRGAHGRYHSLDSSRIFHNTINGPITSGVMGPALKSEQSRNNKLKKKRARIAEPEGEGNELKHRHHHHHHNDGYFRRRHQHHSHHFSEETKPIPPDPEEEKVQKKLDRSLMLVGCAFGACSGCLSGLCLLFAKTGTELLILTIVEKNQFDKVEAWMIVLVLLICALAQLFYLNMSLRKAGPTLVLPLSYCFFNLSSIISGLIYYNQWSQLSKLQVGMIGLGTCCILFGVWIVSLKPPEKIEKAAISTTVPSASKAFTLFPKKISLFGGKATKGKDELGRKAGLSGVEPGEETPLLSDGGGLSEEPEETMEGGHGGAAGVGGLIKAEEGRVFPPIPEAGESGFELDYGHGARPRPALGTRVSSGGSRRSADEAISFSGEEEENEEDHPLRSSSDQSEYCSSSLSESESDDDDDVVAGGIRTLRGFSIGISAVSPGFAIRPNPRPRSRSLASYQGDTGNTVDNGTSNSSNNAIEHRVFGPLGRLGTGLVGRMGTTGGMVRNWRLKRHVSDGQQNAAASADAAGLGQLREEVAQAVRSSNSRVEPAPPLPDQGQEGENVANSQIAEGSVITSPTTPPSISMANADDIESQQERSPDSRGRNGWMRGGGRIRPTPTSPPTSPNGVGRRPMFGRRRKVSIAGDPYIG